MSQHCCDSKTKIARNSILDVIIYMWFGKQNNKFRSIYRYIKLKLIYNWLKTTTMAMETRESKRLQSYFDSEANEDTQSYTGWLNLNSFS